MYVTKNERADVVKLSLIASSPNKSRTCREYEVHIDSKVFKMEVFQSSKSSSKLCLCPGLIERVEVKSIKEVREKLVHAYSLLKPHNTQ